MEPSFPFYSTFLPTTAEELFANLSHLFLPVSYNRYFLRSYFPRSGAYLPPLFRGRPTVIQSSEASFLEADVLSDLFLEPVRLRACREGHQSPLEMWEDKEIREEALTRVPVPLTPAEVRQRWYCTATEAKVFNPSWARTLLRTVLGPQLQGKRWLDISAGWGDRLLAAMSLGMDYQGYDPHQALEPGHTAMITRFGDPARHRVSYHPFETAELGEGLYDVVLSSPPYFTVEEYAPGEEGQSVVTYPQLPQWQVRFLFRSLERAWSRLKEGGYLILHLGDSQKVHLAEATNFFIERYLPLASWEGVIGVAGAAGYARPVWVWKKDKEKRRWSPQRQGERTLLRWYPDIFTELIRYQGEKLAPLWLQEASDSQVAERVRQAVRQSVPVGLREQVAVVLGEDRLITAIVLHHGEPKAQLWGKAMVLLGG